MESWCTTKNCEPALSGLVERAMDTMPRLCIMVLNSASSRKSGPPVPHWSGDAPESDRVLGSPPCIMNPGIILWKSVSS